MSAIGRYPEGGFTLFEMLVTLSIMALIAGIGFPAIERMMARRSFASAADTVMLTLTAARADAIGRGRAVRVTLADGALTASNRRAPIAFADDIAVTWPTQGIVFFGDGSGSGGDATVAAAGRTRRFTVDRVQSRIAVQ